MWTVTHMMRPPLPGHVRALEDEDFLTIACLRCGGTIATFSAKGADVAAIDACLTQHVCTQQASEGSRDRRGRPPPGKFAEVGGEGVPRPPGVVYVPALPHRSNVPRPSDFPIAPSRLRSRETGALARAGKTTAWEAPGAHSFGRGRYRGADAVAARRGEAVLAVLPPVPACTEAVAVAKSTSFRDAAGGTPRPAPVRTAARNLHPPRAPRGRWMTSAQRPW